MVEVKFVECSGAVHHCEVRSENATASATRGPALVFINGLGTDLRIWRGVVESLGSAWPTLCYDWRGHGLTELGSVPFGIEALSADLGELVERLGLGEVVLCGLSLGGLVAQEFALAFPARVRGLCLCATGARIGSAESWRARRQQVLAGGLASISAGVMQRWFGEAFRARQPAAVRGYRNMLERCTRGAYVAALDVLAAADLRPRVARIGAPALVLSGELDTATPPATGAELAALIPGARHELLPGLGHLMCVEAPEQLAQRLELFLRGMGHGRTT